MLSVCTNGSSVINYTQQDDPSLLDVNLLSTSPVLDAVHRIVSELECQDAFFVADIGNLVRQHRHWQSLLSRVEPFYAIKCNSDPIILETLAGLGTGFDCASKGEIEAVLNLGVSPDRIIYANPCKPISHILYARKVGVRMMTFDNAAELVKVKQHFPDALLVLRILTDDSKSTCRFGIKFGAHSGQTLSLLHAAKSLGLNVMGVSFHVGSGCFDANAYDTAVRAARLVFDQGLSVGYHFSLLDIGGGFPGTSNGPLSFQDICSVLNPVIEELFPPCVRVIAEPGRYYASSVFTLSVNITSCRAVINEMDKSFMYYVNDGVYGSFNCLLFDHAVVHPELFIKEGAIIHRKSMKEVPLFSSSIWGPTCDSMDCISNYSLLPELNVGDWLLFENMGAYTVAAASTFNGFSKSPIHYINTECSLDI